MHNTFHIKTFKLRRLFLIEGCRHLRIMKRLGLSILLFLTLSKAYATQLTTDPVATLNSSIKPKGSRIWLTIGNHRFAATLADTEAAGEFAAMLPLTLDMDDLNRNEKHVELPKSLATDKYQPGTIHNGDIMLWGSRTLVVFYEDFESAYSYTRIGQLDNAADLTEKLGRGNAIVVFSKD